MVNPWAFLYPTIHKCENVHLHPMFELATLHPIVKAVDKVNSIERASKYNKGYG